MVRNIFIVINSIMALGLMVIHFTAYVNPQEFWPFAFFGLIYPIVLLINLLFLFLWLPTKTKKASIISFLALSVSYKSNIATLQLSVPEKDTKEISLLTWNVKNFDLYNWSGNKETRRKMFTLLKENRPDILCLQEFYTEDKGNFQNLKTLKKELNYKYVYFAKTYTLEKKRHWGVVVFSDKKIIDSGKLLFSEGTLLNTCMYVDLALSKTQNVRVYNVHLQSNQLSNEDIQALEQKEKTKKSILNLVQKMKKGYINRAKQTHLVLDSKASSPYPSIIVGDFNDVPSSYTYKKLSHNMQDAFVKKGNGLSKTFDVPIPFLRIDYVLMHPLFKINKYRVIRESLSDHYPIIVNFSYQ